MPELLLDHTYMTARSTSRPEQDTNEPSGAWYRALFEHATDLIIVLNADGSRRFVSPSVRRLLGYEVDEYLGYTTFELIHPDDLCTVETSHHECLASPGVQPPVSYRLRHANGTWRTFQAVRNNLLDDPAIQGVVITTRDITDSEVASRLLHEREAQFSSAMDNAAVGMAIVGMDGRWLVVNQALCATTGYSAEGLQQRTFLDLTHPDDIDAHQAPLADLIAGRVASYQQEKRYVHKNGSTIWVHLSISMIRDQSGTPLHTIAQLQDVTARRAAEQTLRDSEARFKALLVNAADIVLLLDSGGRVRWASPSVEVVLGLQAGDLVGRSNMDLVHPDDRGGIRRALIEIVRAGGKPHRATIRFRHQDGSWRWLEFVGANRLNDPAISAVVVNARDVSERVALQEQLRHDALHDPLTGLPNRACFEDHLDSILGSARRYGYQVGLLYIDLDGFKAVNDSIGHSAGDELLIEVGRRLLSQIRPGDLVARLGGDEFAVVLGRLDDRDSIDVIIERIESSITKPVSVSGGTAAVSASIGFAISDSGQIGREELLTRADLSMYTFKQAHPVASLVTKSDRSVPVRRSPERLPLPKLGRTVIAG